MNLEQFNYLLAIKEYGSMNKAAEKIFISQQAISNGIAKLEKELNITLLVRTNKGSHLNEHGLTLCNIVDKFYKDIHMLQENIYYQTPVITILIEKSCEFIWNELFIYIHQNHPHIDFKRVSITMKTLNQEFRKHDNAIAFGFFDNKSLARLDEDLTAYRLCSQYYHAIVSEKNSLYAKSSCSLSDIRQMKIYIQTEKDNATVLTKFLKDYHLDENNQIIYQTNPDLLPYILSQKDTVQFVPSNNTKSISNLKNNIKILPLDELFEVHFAYIHKKDISLPFEMTNFISYLRSIMENLLGHENK